MALAGQLAVRFRGAAGIADSDWLKLAPGVAVMTGRNNVGKSRILKAIGDLPTVLVRPESYPNAPELQVVTDQLRIETDLRVSVRGGFGVRPSTYAVFKGDEQEFEMQWTSTGPGEMGMNYGTPGGPHQRIMWANVGMVRNSTFLPEASTVASIIDRVVYIPPERPVRAAQATSPVNTPAPNGSDLPQVLFYHISHATPQATELENTIVGMFPEVDRILAPITADNTITLTLRDRFAHANVSLDDAGTGLARMLHLIACVLIYEPGRIFLVDEPTTHLHPGSEKVLAAFMRKNKQHDYVISTHSPIFINAIEPDRSWLVTRDERGTIVHAGFSEQAGRRHVFQELGVSPGDVAIAERLLFVEGVTDRLVYPIILKTLGFDVVARNCEVIELEGADAAGPLQQAVAQLATVLSVRYLIYLDGDKAGSLTGERVRFLPVPEIESLFLQDPSAILRGFEEIISLEHPESAAGWKQRWS